MVRPHRFGWNAETAVSNTYQSQPTAAAAAVHQEALSEFEGLRALLVRSGVSVTVFDDPGEPATPDSLFPNNWFSTHADGTLVLYPMAAASRRAERRPQLIAALRRELGVVRVLDLTGWEGEGRYLEGTGSLVLDRVHGIAYAARSLRTDPQLVERASEELGYRPLLFETVPQNGQPVYHTNVVMAVGSSVAVVCLEAIAGAESRAAVRAALRDTGRELVPITLAQLSRFAGNLLELRSRDGVALWVMSTQAFEALDPGQRAVLGRDARILHAPLATIESVGGGSARCMLGELYARTPLA